MKHLKKLDELYESKIHVASKQIPDGIKNWVKTNHGDIKEYKIDQSGNKVIISQPTYIGCQEIYQFFDLAAEQPVGNPISRSGWESDSPQGYEEGQRKNGTVEVPEGKVLIKYCSYPRSVTIYTAQGAQLFLTDNSLVDELTVEEIIILNSAYALKSFARPRFADHFYDNLIEKNLLKKNRSITIDGKNLIQDDKFKKRFEIAADIYKKKTGRYL